METSEYLAAIERDGREFARSCDRAPKAMRIEACPEWVPDDLLWHLTEVHWFWRRIVELRTQDWKQVGELERPAPEALRGMYDEGLEALLTALRTTDPGTPAWTWSKQNDVAWIIRRLAQETAVHRWDADHAAQGRGRPPVIEQHLASDGIDEFLEHFVNSPWRGDAPPISGTVHLHCTDVPGEWLVTPTADGLATTREHAKGDAAMRGTASSLLLVLWRRAPIDAIEVIGDRSVAEELVAYTKLE
jgi:uncharacterized protein (TIGR03083 family)